MSAVLVAACAMPGLLHAEVEVTPRLNASVTYTDNIDLVAPAQESTDATILQVNPGIHLIQTTERMKSYLDYTFQSLFYSDDSDRNSTYNQLDANTTIEAVEKWFFVEAVGLYTQQVVEPTQPSDLENLFPTANIADAISARLAPELRHQFGRTLLDVRYARGFVDYRGRDSAGNEIEDSDNTEGRAFFGSADQTDRLTWGLRYEYDEVTYDFSEGFVYELAAAELGLGLGREWRLLANGGSESDLTLGLTDGGLDASFWEAGVRWYVDENNEFEVLGGERFYGNSWRGHWYYTGRMLHIRANYDERPTSESQQLAHRPITQSVDPAPVPDATDTARLTAQPYINKEMRADVSLVGRRTTLTFEGFNEHRRYFDATPDERTYGGGMDLMRRMNARNTLELGAQLAHYEESNGGQYDDWHYYATLQHSVSPTAHFAVNLTHLDRQGNVGDYRASWIQLSFNKDF